MSARHCVAGLAVVMAAGLAACATHRETEPLAPLPPDGTVAVEFRTDRTQYTIGSTAKLTMVNRSGRRFMMGVCNDVLERQSGEAWTEIPRENTPCITLALLIASGDSATLSFDLKQATRSGTYRVRRQFSVDEGAMASTTYLRTNAFAVVR